MEKLKSICLFGFCLLLLVITLHNLPAGVSDALRYWQAPTVAAPGQSPCPDCIWHMQGTVADTRIRSRRGTRLDVTLTLADTSTQQAILTFWLPYSADRHEARFPRHRAVTVERWGPTGVVTRVFADGTPYRTEDHPVEKLATELELALVAGLVFAAFVRSSLLPIARRRPG